MYVGTCNLDAVYHGACKLAKLFVGTCEVFSAPPVWQAFVPHPTTGVMTDLIDGTGTVSNARTATINLRNEDDEFGEQATLTVGYVGGRKSGSTIYGTDGSGDPLTDLPYAASFPAAQNLALSNRTFSSWTSGASVTANDATGIDGTTSAAEIEDANATYALAKVLNVDPTIPDDETLAIGLFLKKNATTTNWGIVQLEYAGSGTTYFRMTFNATTGTGQATVGPSGTEMSITEIGDYYLFTFFTFEPGTSRNDVTIKVYPAWSANIGGTFDSSLQEAIHVDALQAVEGVADLEHAEALFGAPIYTTTAAVTRDKDEIEIPYANHSNTKGTYQLEVNVSGNGNILAEFLYYEDGDYVLTDGTNTVSVTVGTGERTITVSYGDSTMSLDVDGTSDSGTYDGSLISDSTLDIGRDSEFPLLIRNLRWWDTKISP